MRILAVVATFILLLVCTRLFSQRNQWGGNGYETFTEKAHVGIVAGYSGFKQNTVELGIGFQPWEVQSFFVGYPFAGFLLLHEFDPNQKFYGNSVNFWYLSGFFACGLGANRYSDYQNQTLGIKPMVGFSCLRVGVMYAYNIYLNKNKIPELYPHSLTVKYYLPVWRKKE